MRAESKTHALSMQLHPSDRENPNQPASNGIPVQPGLSAGRLLVIFAPILVLLGATAALAVSAWLVGWHSTEMLIAAGLSGAVAGTLAMYLLYRQIRERQAATLALQGVTARISAVVESAMDAIITVDGGQRIVLFNAAAEAMFGCPRSEAIGAPLAWFIPERFRTVHATHVQRFGETGAVSRRMGAMRIVTGLRRNGEEFPIDASISQLEEPGGKFYTVILRDISERVRVEEALRRSQAELRELGAAAHAAREQEKSRIARELHDELAQSLTALQMDVAWLKERGAGIHPAATARLFKMEGLLEQTVASTRRIASDLRPLMLDDLGLVPAVEWLAETFTQRSGVPCELAVNRHELELPDAHATAVFRIVQESLANVAKHAAASRVEVTIEHTGSELALRIRDDGSGFSSKNPRKPNSYGLVGLRERASLLGGQASIISAPGQGTQIEVRLPVAPPTGPS